VLFWNMWQKQIYDWWNVVDDSLHIRQPSLYRLDETSPETFCRFGRYLEFLCFLFPTVIYVLPSFKALICLSYAHSRTPSFRIYFETFYNLNCIAVHHVLVIVNRSAFLETRIWHLSSQYQSQKNISATFSMHNSNSNLKIVVRRIVSDIFDILIPNINYSEWLLLQSNDLSVHKCRIAGCTG
jgi:hypothetical protein